MADATEDQGAGPVSRRSRLWARLRGLGRSRQLSGAIVAAGALALLASACGDDSDTGADPDRAVEADEPGSPPASEQTGAEHRRGPDPTPETISAPAGPFDIASVSIPSSVDGFGGGTIYHPTDLSEGTFGAYAFAPGTFMTDEQYAWVGDRIASHGFVVFLIDTNSPNDRPPSRGEQLIAALDYLVADSAVRDHVDPERLAVGGHSNGGGGSLEAAVRRSSLRAVVALQPWHPTTRSFPEIATPTLIIGAQDDDLADVDSHSKPFYESIPPPTDKAYLELRGKPHDVATQNDTTQASAMIAWLKRYVDNDTRYTQFLCPPPEPDPTISEHSDTCPP